MAARELAAVLLATAGIFLAAQTIAMAPLLLTYSPVGPLEAYDSGLFVSLAAGSASQLLISSILVFARRPLAARLFAESTQGVVQIDGADLTRALLTALGAYFLTTALAHELPTAVQGYAADPANTSNPTFWRWAIQLAIGTTLFLGARGIAGGVTALRQAGRRRA